MLLLHSLINEHLMFHHQTSHVLRDSTFPTAVCAFLSAVAGGILPEDNPLKWIVFTAVVICLLVLVFVIIGILTFQRSEMYVSYYWCSGLLCIHKI